MSNHMSGADMWGFIATDSLFCDWIAPSRVTRAGDGLWKLYRTALDDSKAKETTASGAALLSALKEAPRLLRKRMKKARETELVTIQQHLSNTKETLPWPQQPHAISYNLKLKFHYHYWLLYLHPPPLSLPTSLSSFTKHLVTELIGSKPRNAKIRQNRAAVSDHADVLGPM